jgi:hypothetical protein
LFRIFVLGLVVFLGGWFLGGWLRRDIERDEWRPLKRVELQRREQRCPKCTPPGTAT